MSNIHKNFNSRTREGATKKQLGGRIGLLVSIHAPVWVRLPANCLNAFLPKFQFTHPCGCDNGAAVKRQRGNSFNSRTRVGATGPLFHVITVNDVSIHAPVWVRPFDENNLTLYFKFQFTHPCGCDVLSGLPLPRQKGFNSRTRVGATA